MIEHFTIININITAFWFVLPCSLVKTWQYLIESAPSILLIWKLEAAGFSETMVPTYLPGNTGS